MFRPPVTVLTSAPNPGIDLLLACEDRQTSERPMANDDNAGGNHRRQSELETRRRRPDNPNSAAVIDRGGIDDVEAD